MLTRWLQVSRSRAMYSAATRRALVLVGGIDRALQCRDRAQELGRRQAAEERADLCRRPCG
jgi:hypothetical protein